jgi:Flp pilus assembly protein TadG
MKRTSIRRYKRQGGNAAIEFALGFAFLWSIVSGIYQMGHSLYTYNQLSVGIANAARFAGRESIVPSKEQYKARIRNVAVFGNPDGTGTAMVRGLSAANIDVDIEEDTAGVPKNVTVSVNNFAIDGVFWTTSLVDKPYSTARYAGRYQPFGA